MCQTLLIHNSSLVAMALTLPKLIIKSRTRAFPSDWPNRCVQYSLSSVWAVFDNPAMFLRFEFSAMRQGSSEANIKAFSKVSSDWSMFIL